MKTFEQFTEGSLHKWFKGSKSKDGKPGWVNVKTGGTCASDEPGEGTPKCVSSSKRASMTKAERDSASRRKKAADPGQQQKSGAAKPTYVATDKKKKVEEAKDLLKVAKELTKASKMHKGQAEKLKKHADDMKSVDEACWKGYKAYGMKKKGGKMVPNCKPVGSVKKEEVQTEAKVDKGRSDYGKASIRNYRRSGPGHGEPAMFDPENKRGKTIDKRREEHKERRGVKKAKVPAYKVDESMGGGVPLTPPELEIQKKMSRLNMRLARKRNQEMQKAKIKDTETAPEQVKEGNKVLFPLGDVHSGESKKKTLVWKKKEKGSSEQVKEAKSAAWQRKEGKRESGGLNQKGVDSYRRENPGSKLKTAVTTKPSKLKKGSKSANRRKSFCARMSGMKKKLTSAKTANDPDSRINKSLRKWNCSYEPDGTPIMEKEDKAFNFVLNKLKSKYGSGVMTKGDKMPEPSAAQKKKNAAIRAKRAKEDHRDPTEKASDGRYSDRHSNRGSD